MTKRNPRYTDEFRASAVLMLMAAGWPDTKGALARVSNHLTMPANTLARWAKRQNNPAPSNLVDVKKKSQIEMLEELRYLILGEMGEAYHDAPLSQLATSYGILTDKQRLLSGESTDNSAMNINIRYDEND